MDSGHSSGQQFRVAYAMDLSSTLPPQEIVEGESESYKDALSTLQGAKALLLATADERKGLKRLQEKNDELAHALEDQSNIHALNDIHLMRQFYDDVTTGSARVDARIRAVESVQWLDLHDKYGIRRQHLLGESRNMKALEEKAMRANAMAALRHYLGEFQVKKIRSQLESADAWFGAQERRLKEEVLMLNADGSRSVAEVQRSEQIDAALRNENLDPNLSSVFTRRGKTLAEASARVYQSFAVWAGQAKAQLEQTKLESAAAAKHLKNRLMSAEAEASYLRARVAELEASVAASGADELGIREGIQAKYLPTQRSLQDQITQLRDQMQHAEDAVAHDREEIAGAKRLAAALKNYDPNSPSVSGDDSLDSRESMFKEYIKHLTTKDIAMNDRLQKQIDQKFESLQALGTAEAEAHARLASAQARSRGSMIALDKHRLRTAADRNALEIMFKALSGKKESLDKKLARAEERAAVKMRSAKIKDKNSTLLQALSESPRRTASAAAGHRNTTITKADGPAAQRQPRLTTRAPTQIAGKSASITLTKPSQPSARRRSSSGLIPEAEASQTDSTTRGGLRAQLSARRRSSIGGDDSSLSGQRAVSPMPSETSEAISADLSGSLPVVARRASFSRRGSKDLTPHPPSEQREGVAKHGRPPRVVRVNTVTVPSAAAVGSKTIVPSMDLLPQTSEAEAANAEPDEPPEEEVQLEPYTMCGRSGCTILAATFTFFIVDQRLTKLIKEAPAVVAEEPPTDPEPYHRKFDHVKPALPKDIYYRNKRRAAPIRRRMFSNDDAEDELLVENPLVKYLVIDENYCMTYDFPEAMVAVSRIMTTLCNLGYLDAPSNTHHALCDLFAYYNVNFLLDDFEPCNQIISRSVYAFAADTSPKLWRRYQESLQAIRYQDNQQREDELRRFCATVVKFAFDMFGHVVDAEQKFFKMGYSLTVEETDVNVWVRMAEVLNPVFGALAVIVNSTFENTVDSRNRADLDSEAEHAPAAADLLVVPPPAECGLGADMLVLLNRASEHVYSAVSLANGKAGKVEAATLSSQTKAPSAALEVSSDMHPIAEAGLGLQNKVLGEIFYPLSFLHSTGFFLTLYRAAYMTSMVSRNTRSPYFHLLHDWLVTHYPDGWKNSQWKPGMSKGAMKSLLLRDIQILRAFSGYFYYTGLGLDVMDLEQAERLFAGELNALVLHGDIFGHSGMASTAGEEVSALDSPVKASRLSTVNRGGISCHDLSLLSLIGCLVPPALPVIVVLRMILKLAFKQIKAMGVTSIDTMEAKRECMQRASQLEMRRTSEIEEAVVESSLPMAQKATYQKLEILAIELLSRVQVQTTAYEALLAQRYALKRLENVAEEELALGIERSPPVVPQAVIVPDSITVGGEPFIRHGDAMSLELPYSTIQRLESILCEIKDLSHAIARGTKTLCTMVSVRFQSLLEALAEVVTVVKFHRRRADDWADQQRHSVDHHTLVASNRRSIIAICEAMLDACGVSMDAAVVSHQLRRAEASCERIISARRKIRFAVDESVDIPDKRALAPVSRLEIAKEAIASFRGNANPGIRDKLLSKHIASGIEKTSDADEMESFQQYLMEEMSNAVVHASHWRTEWEEIVKQESQCRDQKSPDRGIGVEASLAEHLHGSDVRLADLLGVSTEGNKGGEVFADNMAVVSGMQWRLTRGVLRIGADAFAESAV